ncbi:unnamed protein product, partial [Amoebophrya sp. A25]
MRKSAVDRIAEGPTNAVFEADMLRSSAMEMLYGEDRLDNASKIGGAQVVTADGERMGDSKASKIPPSSSPSKVSALTLQTSPARLSSLAVKPIALSERSVSEHRDQDFSPGASEGSKISRKSNDGGSAGKQDLKLDDAESPIVEEFIMRTSGVGTFLPEKPPKTGEGHEAAPEEDDAVVEFLRRSVPGPENRPAEQKITSIDNTSTNLADESAALPPTSERKKSLSSMPLDELERRLEIMQEILQDTAANFRLTAAERQSIEDSLLDTESRISEEVTLKSNYNGNGEEKLANVEEETWGSKFDEEIPTSRKVEQNTTSFQNVPAASPRNIQATSSKQVEATSSKYGEATNSKSLEASSSKNLEASGPKNVASSSSKTSTSKTREFRIAAVGSGGAVDRYMSRNIMELLQLKPQTSSESSSKTTENQQPLPVNNTASTTAMHQTNNIPSSLDGSRAGSVIARQRYSSPAAKPLSEFRPSQPPPAPPGRISLRTQLPNAGGNRNAPGKISVRGRCTEQEVTTTTAEVFQDFPASSSASMFGDQARQTSSTMMGASAVGSLRVHRSMLQAQGFAGLESEQVQMADPQRGPRGTQTAQSPSPSPIAPNEKPSFVDVVDGSFDVSLLLASSPHANPTQAVGDGDTTTTSPIRRMGDLDATAGPQKYKQQLPYGRQYDRDFLGDMRHPRGSYRAPVQRDSSKRQ